MPLPYSTPSLLRRMACWLYEGMLLFGVVFIAGYLFGTLSQTRNAMDNRHALQAFLFVVFGIYFVWLWSKGQTLAMKTWHIRLESASGMPPTSGQAAKRYLLACLLFPISWAWALFAADRQFLHDRLAGTRLVNAAPSAR